MPEIQREDGVTICFETFGDASAPAVLLLHGYTSESRMWAEQWQALEPDYFVIVPDMRGHGRSSAPEGLDAYAIELFADDIKALLDQLEVELAAVVGCSFGGMVALQFATAHPQRVAALVVSDAGAAYDHPHYAHAYRERERGIDAMVEEARKRGAGGMGKKAASGVRDTFLSQGVRANWERARAEGIIGGWHARRTRPDLLPIIGQRLTMPTLVCIGTEDPVFSAAELMIEQLPKARYAVFEGAGHGLPARRPRQFTRELLAFLGYVEDGKPIAGRRTIPAER